MSCALFRVDGSSRLGMGHVMRCLAFAEELERLGWKSIFAMKAFERGVVTFVGSRGHAVEELPPELMPEDDARFTRELADRSAARLLVTDVCHRAAVANRRELVVYHCLLEADFTLVVLAGSDVVDLPGDVIVSPYFRTRYPSVPSGGERLHLLGPAYFIFRREFVAAARESRSISPKARRVLVTIGGSDELHLTVKVIRALCALADPDLNVRIVIGPQYSEPLKREIEEGRRVLAGESELLGHDANVADAMLWADLAITGDGLTKYETAVTGTPSVMLSRPDSEGFINDDFASAGTTAHVGDGAAIEVDALAAEIRRVLVDASLRWSMSRRGKAVVDGQGLNRIIATLPVGVVS